MSYKAPKFLLGGVNLRRNFFGLNTVTTGAYGAVEHVITLVPVFALIYGVSKLLIFKSFPIFRTFHLALRPRKRPVH